MSAVTFHTVCHTSEIAEGEARRFRIEETAVAVFCVGGEFFALDDHCPHAGASLACGFVTGDVVSCRIHHWRFRITDGLYLDEAKPALNAKTYPVRVEGDFIQVGL